MRIRPALVCPKCRGELAFPVSDASCRACKRVYPYRNGKLYFTEAFKSHDPLDKIKEALKRRLGNAFYTIGVSLVAPTFPFSLRRAVLRWSNPQTDLIVDIGSGNHRIDEAVIALDAVDYPAVDIVADITALPFRDGSIDGLVSRSLLEHVWPLDKAVHEFKRCTRAGGFNVHLIPFLFPFHASPHDYQRLTHAGAARLFENWQILAQYNATGPVTLFLVNFVEFLSAVGSFGQPRVKAFLYLSLCLLLFPIKFLDAPFVNRPAYISMAPTILTAARKPSSGESQPSPQ